MTPEQINRTLVEAEGGCWHKHKFGTCPSTCKKCHKSFFERDDIAKANPDFSKWGEFGRLLKIASKIGKWVEINTTLNPSDLSYAASIVVGDVNGYKEIGSDSIDQIPLLVATELARIIKKENK